MHPDEPGPNGEPSDFSIGADEQAAREALTSGRRMRRRRHFWRSIPGAPRCKLCTAPIGGPAGAIFRLIGKGPWQGNPKYCRWCFRSLYRHRTGAEVECTLLFADIRDSTRLAETMPARDFRREMDQFYATAVAVLTDHDAFVDKFVGDEVIGIFIPALTNGAHARQAVEAGLELLRAVARQIGHPIGIGVNTGVAFVGAVGTEDHIEFTALGDPVNVAARLASVAGPGELLVAVATARAAGLTDTPVERRVLRLKGKSEVTEVLVLAL